MPEFHLDRGNCAERFKALDSFTQGYIEAMFFTDCEHGTFRADPADIGGRVWDPEKHSSLPGDASLDDLSEDAWKAIADDCRDFQEAKAELLERAYTLADAYRSTGRLPWGAAGYDAERAGNDFWYTRNGHGTGFWDRELGEVGDKLTEMAKPYGSADCYLGDDGKIYVS